MKNDILKFQKKKVGEMTLREFNEYHHEWLEFLQKVEEYGKSMNTFTKLLTRGLADRVGHR